MSKRSQEFSRKKKAAKLAAQHNNVDSRPAQVRPERCPICQHIVRASNFEDHKRKCLASVQAETEAAQLKMLRERLDAYEGETDDGFDIERCKCGRKICLVPTSYGEYTVYDIDWTDRTAAEIHICDGAKDPADSALGFTDQQAIIIIRRRIRQKVSKRGR